MSLNEAKIAISTLRKGMFVSRLDRPWLETPFPLQGFPVSSPDEIVQLRKLCNHVYVDLTLGEAPDPRSIIHDLEDRRGSAAADEIRALRVEEYPRRAALREELEQATPTYEALNDRVGLVMRDLREGKNLDFEALRDGVKAMIDSVIRNPEAFACLIELKRKDIYAYRHALGASVWAATLGRHLGLPRADIETLALGGLLLDVGKSRLPLELLNKTGRLSDAEMKLMQTHVEHSLDILTDTPDVPEPVREMVASHHERFDGRGYPRGLRGSDIPLFGRIAGIVDTYDALTSPRLYAKPMSPHGAVNILYEWRDMDFQKELVEQFIQAVGIYPTGTLVELSTGEVGVIISLNGVRRLHPRLMVILDKDKQPYQEFVELDLRDSADSETPITIRRGLPPGAHGVDPENMFL